MQLLETFKAIKENNKRLDILVNCAGAFDGPAWEKEIVTNLVKKTMIYQQIVPKFENI